MCYFVTVAVQPNKESALAHLREAGLSLHPSGNRQLAAAFPAGHRLFEVTLGGCSCGLYAAAIGGPTEEEVRTKYKKKGWSRARVERAIESKRRTGRMGDGTPLFKAFMQAVSATVADAKRFFLFAHSYTAGTDAESFGMLPSLVFSLDGFLQGGGVYPEDTIAEVRA